MKLSIVTTLYRSEKYLEEFYERISKEAIKITDEYEIIIVNDGSPDASVNIAISLHEKDERVVVVDLSRNFGHHKALMTGLSMAEGENIFLIDSDLEEAPELVGEFWKAYQEENVDVIYGVQEKRKGGCVEKVTGAAFYKFFNFVSDVKIPENFLTVRLMSHQYVESLLQFEERELTFAALCTLAGFVQKPLIVRKHHKGESTYDFRKKVDIIVNSVTSTSAKPLWMIFHIGFLLTLFAVAFILYTLGAKFFFSSPVSGWTSVIVSIWLLGGMTIASLGVIGIYISKIFTETKNRPYVIVKKVYKKEGK